MEFGVDSHHSERVVINFSNFRLQLIVDLLDLPHYYHFFEGHSLDQG